MEENKTLKEKLVEEAQQLAESADLNGKYQKLADLKKKWKKTLHEDESFFDKELGDKFDGFIRKIEQTQTEMIKSVEETKENIIDQAKQLLDSKNFKAATDKMNDLFEQFKSSGRADKQKDDELWTKFKDVKDEFYAKKNEYFANIKTNLENNKLAKEDIIEKAKAVLSVENIKEASNKMDELMQEWKKTGRADKSINDQLWTSFNEVRQEFYKKRSERYAQMKQEYTAKAEAKKELIAKAKKCLAMSTFTDEEKAEIKQIRADWKAIGFAGKENEDALWQEFNTVVNKYFDNMKYYG